jgi:hypothetical protein
MVSESQLMEKGLEDGYEDGISNNPLPETPKSPAYWEKQRHGEQAGEIYNRMVGWEAESE